MQRHGNAKLLAQAFDDHLNFWQNAPVAAYNEGGQVYLDVIVERYSDDCHDRLIQSLAEFCCKPSIVPKVGGLMGDSAVERLTVRNLNRFEKGITFEPRSDYDAVDLASTHQAYSMNIKDYDGVCCVRYDLPRTKKEAYGDHLGDTTVRIIRFKFYKMCPLRIVLELYRMFDARHTRDAQKQLGCGVTRVIGTNLPREDEDPFMLHFFLHSFDRD